MVFYLQLIAQRYSNLAPAPSLAKEGEKIIWILLALSKANKESPFLFKREWDLEDELKRFNNKRTLFDIHLVQTRLI